MIQAPQGDGRPCPSQMEQWKPCLVKPCFHWRYGSWSECRTEVSQQGVADTLPFLFSSRVFFLVPPTCGSRPGASWSNKEIEKQ